MTGRGPALRAVGSGRGRATVVRNVVTVLGVAAVIFVAFAIWWSWPW